MTPTGSIIGGKYQILHEVGRGAMSIVYLAMDIQQGKQYAVKEVLKQSSNSSRNEIIINSLLAEANLLKRLKHPALPRIIDMLDTGSIFYIIMDYIEGNSLDQILKQDGPQPEERVTAWVKQVADALHYLHSQNPSIIYRDMKPANIMLKPDGTVKIIDLGIAREYKPDKIADTTVLGTAGYAPPEQYSGQTDPRSDIYALGMTMHHLLTGLKPGPGIPYCPVRQLDPALSEGIEAIIDKCVQPAQENRFQSCPEVIAALDNPKKTIREYRKRTGKSFSFPKFNLFETLFGTREQPSLPGISVDKLNDLASALPRISSMGDIEMLRTHLKHSDFSSFEASACSKLQHLHILCSEQSQDLMMLRSYGFRPGLYFTRSGTWGMVIGADGYQILECVTACGARLETLKIRGTDVRALQIDRLTGLRILHLNQNAKLEQIKGLSSLKELREVNLEASPIRSALELNNCSQLCHLNISNTYIRLIHSHAPLENLKCFLADHTPVQDIGFLTDSHALETLRVSNTNILKLPALELLHDLELMDCSHTFITALDHTALPGNLKKLYLGGTSVHRIPSAVRDLHDLEYLDLSELNLEELPNWLPGMASKFIVDKTYKVLWTDRPTDIDAPTEELICTSRSKTVINLKGTQIEGVDMTIFSQSISMVQQWFEGQNQKPEDLLVQDEEENTDLNEIKVVFLGDGEAGKSLVVARLLNDGICPDSFDGDATPGISIKDLQYDLDDRRVQVHFWDFGGQEILHSMHRMFLTQRTLYVILLNARDDTQDDRARYWLHNVKSFADGAPVLLVLNKIDQNPNASVNESGLRAMYPGLTEIVRLSALKDSQQDFNSKFTAALKRQVSLFETLKYPFPPAWNRLKYRLRNMTESYIHSPAYQRISEECGVAPDEETRTALLKWFTDLGISFCYSGSPKLEDYVILRPDWITNAIYILLYNPIDGLKNGIASHESIFRMLHPSPARKADIKCVLPGETYALHDVEYVLNVFRRFRLSYLIRDNEEFIPMLCQRSDKPVAAEYENDPQTLEFQMVYDYLPNNVLHRLMVDIHRDLNTENVWLTGALFEQKGTSLSAVVKSDANVLRILVRSTDLRQPAEFYLDIIKQAVEQINDELRLKPIQKLVAYKEDGITDRFDYDELIGLRDHGITGCFSKQRNKVIQIDDILRKTDHYVDTNCRKLISDLLQICGQMQANSLFWNVSENVRNTQLRDSLRILDYSVADQSLSGISAGGIQPGELDLDIRRDAGIPWTICEGLNLKGASASQMKYWDDHLSKLLENYNENGLPFLIMVSYVTCPRARFLELCNAYTSHISNFHPGSYTLQHVSAIPSTDVTYDSNHFLQARKCIYSCGGFQTTVYHLFARMKQEDE